MHGSARPSNQEQRGAPFCSQTRDKHKLAAMNRSEVSGGNEIATASVAVASVP